MPSSSRRPSATHLALTVLAGASLVAAQTCPSGQSFYAASSSLGTTDLCCPTFNDQPNCNYVFFDGGNMLFQCDYTPADSAYYFTTGSGTTEMDIAVYGAAGGTIDGIYGGFGDVIYGTAKANPFTYYSIFVGVGGGSGTETSGAGGGTSAIYDNGSGAFLFAGGGGGAGQEGLGENGGSSSLGYTGDYRGADAFGATVGAGGAGAKGGLSPDADSGLGGGGGQSQIPAEFGSNLLHGFNFGGAYVRINIKCSKVDVPTTTITESAPQSTVLITSTVDSDVVTVTPSPPVVLTSVVEVSGSQEPTTVVTTIAPGASTVTRTFSTNPLTTQTVTVSQEPTATTQVETSFVTPAPSVVVSTQTLPEIFTTDFRTATFTLANSTVTSTLAPTATLTATRTANVTAGVVTVTSTRVITSTTAAVNPCIQFKLVFPAACCPNTYVAMSGRARHRRAGHFGRRALTTLTVSGEPTTIYTTIGGASTTTLPTPTTVTTVTSNISGAQETVRSTVSLDADVVTLDETSTGPGSTEIVRTTLDRSTIRATSTLLSTLEPSVVSSVVTTQPLLSTIATTTVTQSGSVQTSLVQGDAAQATITQTNTVAGQTTTTTTTSTQYAQATTCAIQLAGTQRNCPIPLLAAADQLVQITLLNAQKLLSLGGRPVIVDCGTAGTYYY